MLMWFVFGVFGIVPEVFGSYYLVQVGFWEVIIWSKFVFLAYKIVVSSDLFGTLSYHFVFFMCPNFWQFSKNSLFFSKKGCKIGFFSLFVFFVLFLFCFCFVFFVGCCFVFLKGLRVR